MDVNATNVNRTSAQSETKFIPGADQAAMKKTQAADLNAGGNGLAISADQTEEIVASLENYMNVLQTSLGFEVNKDTDQVVVTITNRETNEVIRQIPPEELISLQERMKELTGIIFSETV